jgi:predicted dehydrogenase
MGGSEKKLTVTFLGCGQAARTHARILSRVAPGTRLNFASRDHDRAKQFARGFHGAGTFSSYESALADPAAGVAVVTTPPDRHLELTRAALGAGKDVIVEKPAFPAPSDFAEVRELAGSAGRRVFVAENYFYKPLRRRLARLLAEGAVGDPLFLRMNAVKRQEVHGWRADPTRSEGGGLFEGGIHWINLISNLGPEVERVSGVRAGERPGHALTDEARGTEESLVVTFEFRGGMVGTLAFSWEVPSPLRGVRISTLYGRGGSVWFESNGIFVVARGSRTRVFFPGVRDLSGYRAMWVDFVDALLTGREPAMTLDLAERDVRFVRDVYRSLEQE